MFVGEGYFTVAALESFSGEKITEDLVAHTGVKGDFARHIDLPFLVETFRRKFAVSKGKEHQKFAVFPDHEAGSRIVPAACGSEKVMPQTA